MITQEKFEELYAQMTPRQKAIIDMFGLLDPNNITDDVPSIELEDGTTISAWGFDGGETDKFQLLHRHNIAIIEMFYDSNNINMDLE